MQNTCFTKVKLIFNYGSNQILVKLRGRGSLRPDSKNHSEVLLLTPAAV